MLNTNFDLVISSPWVGPKLTDCSLPNKQIPSRGSMVGVSAFLRNFCHSVQKSCQHANLLLGNGSPVTNKLGGGTMYKLGLLTLLLISGTFTGANADTPGVVTCPPGTYKVCTRHPV